MIAFVVLVNTAVGVTQEVKADRAITALAQLSAPVVRVRRDGVETSVPAAELVPGDVVLLGEGDIVPADCDLLEASSVLVDESALTGESIAVGKAAPHERGGRRRAVVGNRRRQGAGGRGGDAGPGRRARWDRSRR